MAETGAPTGTAHVGTEEHGRHSGVHLSSPPPTALCTTPRDEPASERPAR